MTVFETRKRSNFICISFVLKRQAKIKAVSTQIMCRGKHSNYLLKDETKPIIPSKGLGLQVTNHKNYPLLIFKKLGSSMCLISTKGNFHITCDGITDSFQQYRQWYPLLLIIYQGRITKRTLVKRTKSSIQSYTMSYMCNTAELEEIDDNFYMYQRDELIYWGKLESRQEKTIQKVSIKKTLLCTL